MFLAKYFAIWVLSVAACNGHLKLSTDLNRNFSHPVAQNPSTFIMFEVTHQVNDAHEAEVWCVTWRKNRILSGSSDGKVKLWGHDLSPLREWQASALAITSVATDGHIGVSCAMDGQLKVWDFASGELKSEIEVGCVNAWSICFHPTNSDLLAVSGFQGNINVYSLASGSIVSTYKTTHTAFAHGIAYSADGQQIACGNKDGVLSIFDTQSQEVIRSIEAHAAPIRSLAFSPDGKTIYTASDDTHIGVFDVQSGDKVAALTGHSSWVLDIDASSVGNYIVTGSADKKVKIWTPADRKCVNTLEWHSGQVWAVAWNDLGTSFVSGGDGKGLLVYKSLSQ